MYSEFMDNYDNIDIDELVKDVLNEESCSTYIERPPAQKFVPEEQEVYRVPKSLYFGIIKSTFVNICSVGT